MAPPKNKFSPFLIAALAAFYLLWPGLNGVLQAHGAQLRYVKKVIDGDTIILENGDHVRYIGINSPEIGEPFYEEAKKRNASMVEDRRVRLEVCPQETRDKYGRLLAFIYVDDTLVNKVLVTEGLARTFVIPPCGLEKSAEFGSAEKSAKAAKLGIWGDQDSIQARAVPIKPGEAARYVDRYVKVRAKVNRVHKTRDAVFLDIGEKGAALSIVIFKKAMKDIEGRGVDLAALRGKTVTVFGAIKMYKGRPEIVVNSPSQLKVD